MKRALAHGIIGIWSATLATVLGAQLRSDTEGEELAKDAALGGLIIGAAMAVRWAIQEIDQ